MFSVPADDNATFRHTVDTQGNITEGRDDNEVETDSEMTTSEDMTTGQYRQLCPQWLSVSLLNLQT